MVNYMNPYNNTGFPNYGNQYPVNQQNAQRYEIIHVNGENGARALQMLPNSNALLLDDTQPIVWLAQTDGAGYKTVTPYTITPYQPEPTVDVKTLEHRIARLEEIVSAKSEKSDTATAE